jgi:esterase/lipase superfamily enzyme
MNDTRETFVCARTAAVERSPRPQFRWLALACLLLTACSTKLMPTPNLYVDTETNPFAQVVPEYRSNEVQMLYATDREPETRHGRLHYGCGRSPSLAFGTCAVTIGRNVTWEQLVHNSRVRKRDVPLTLSIGSLEELGRFPETPALTVEDLEQHAWIEGEFMAEFSRRLALTPRKEAFVFIHGYHDSFENGAFVGAELWHFLGREGVPIVYSWPAGHGGLLEGYDYDRESGLFTVYHLKKLISLLVTCPDLEAVSIIAHSRGTAVATDALRGLVIAAHGAGLDPREAYKLNNVILAAADIDVAVATQALAAERLEAAAERSTLYVSEHDKALSISGLLYADRRLGKLGYDELTEFERSIVSAGLRTTYVDARVPAKGWGHSYFHQDPAVSSDLILVLRDNRGPGAANGRPLREVGPNYWVIGENYPNGDDGGE